MNIRTNAIVIWNEPTCSLALGIPEVVFAEAIGSGADGSIGAACNETIGDRWTRVDDIDRSDDLRDTIDDDLATTKPNFGMIQSVEE